MTPNAKWHDKAARHNSQSSSPCWIAGLLPGSVKRRNTSFHLLYCAAASSVDTLSLSAMSSRMGKRHTWNHSLSPRFDNTALSTLTNRTPLLAQDALAAPVRTQTMDYPKSWNTMTDPRNNLSQKQRGAEAEGGVMSRLRLRRCSVQFSRCVQQTQSQKH